MISDSNEGVRIFTVKRVSGSILGIKLLKSVRTRSEGSRIANALAVAALLAAVQPALTPVLSAQALQSAPPLAAPAAGPQALCEPQVVGERRIPKDSIIARMSSHQGDPYDAESVERDFNSIWNTGYFEKLQIEKVETPTCVQLIVYVTEKPHIATIDYQGLNAVTLSVVEERFK